MSHAETRDGAEISNEEYRKLEQIEEPAPKQRHYMHPTDPALTWCGKPDSPISTYLGGFAEGTAASDITCVDCLHLLINKGAEWWWAIHRMWYGTACAQGQHKGCI